MSLFCQINGVYVFAKTYTGLVNGCLPIKYKTVIVSVIFIAFCFRLCPQFSLTAIIHSADYHRIKKVTF